MARPVAASLASIPHRLVLYISLALGWLMLSPMVTQLLSSGVVPGLADKDFANYWVGANLAIHGQVADIYGPWDTYFAHMRAAMGPAFPWHNWSYPPHYLLLMLPLALFEYKLAMIVFMVTTGAFFAFAFGKFTGSRGPVMWLAALPFVIINVWCAQNGFLYGGFMLLLLHWRERRPVLAGICLGFLTMKPQLALLVPFLLLAERRWRVLVSGTVTTGLLVLVSAAVFGWSAWLGFATNIIPYQTMVMRELVGTFHWMMPSVFGALRLEGWKAADALAVHLVVALPVGVMTLWGFLAVREAWHRACLLTVATFIVTPYALNYDFGFLAAGLAVYAWRTRDQAGPREQVLLESAMALPLVMMFLGRFGVPVAPFILLPLFVLIVWRARQDFVTSLPPRLAALTRQPLFG